MLEVAIKGDAKEIAALVVALQEQRKRSDPIILRVGETKLGSLLAEAAKLQPCQEPGS